MSELASALGAGAKAGLVLAVLALAAARGVHGQPAAPLPAAPATAGPATASGSAFPEPSGADRPIDPAARTGDPVARWRPYVAEASARFGVPVEWIERVMRAESGGFTTLAGRPITSRAGAMGLMQLMPATWAAMRAQHGLGPDPHAPRDNILAGTAYLAAMHARFGYPGLFGAYNAGPARYAEWLAGRRELPAETRAYLVAVTGESLPSAGTRPMPSAAPAPQRPGLFAVRGEASEAIEVTSEPGQPSPNPLFAVRRVPPRPAPED